MKKVLVFLFLFTATSLYAQPINKKQYTLTAAARTDGLTVRGQGIAYYKVAWNVIGTASACSFTLDGSRDNSTWNASVISATTCTSDGVTAMTAAGTSNSYVSINLTSFTATQNASIILTISGYTDASAGISGGLGTSTYVAYFDSCCTLKGHSGFTYNGAGVITLSGDGLFNGVTVGKGLASVATNTALGVSALAANTVGQQNTAIGWNALTANIQGSVNTAIGKSALASLNTNNSQNTAIGSSTLTNQTSGSNNTALGYAAGGAEISGSNNLFIGGLAGLYATTASNEFYINTLDQSTNAAEKTNSLMYGTFNAAPSSQTLAINAITTNTYSLGVGIAPISGYIFTAHATTNENFTVAGHTGLSTGITLRGLNDAGAALVGVELRASDLLYTTDDTFKVVRGGVTVETLSATGWAFTAIGSNTMTVNGTLPTGYVFSVVAGTSQLNGRVYAANLTAAAGVQSGAICMAATGELINDSVSCLASSIRFKHNINNLDNDLGLKTVLALRPVEFYYNDAGPVLNSKSHNMEQIGFIAEEAEKADKRLVGYDNEGKVRTFRYENYVASLTLAIQQQQQQIEQLKKRRRLFGIF